MRKQFHMSKMYKKIYFVGIKGVGMATLALIAKQAGFEVCGSDVSSEFITDKILEKEGIDIFPGFSEGNINDFVLDTNISEVLVVTTAAHGGFDNAESSFAKSLGIKVITHGQAVGVFMKGEIFGRQNQIGISIAGSHGKTTIAAFIAFVFSKLGFDPSYTVGTSEIFPLGSAGHFGQGKYFIAEADEYISEIKHDRKPKFLYQNPNFLILNNIDFDHPDYYKTIEDVEIAFGDLISNVQENGSIILNGDDFRLEKLCKKIRRDISVITFGTDKKNDISISEYVQAGKQSSFKVYSKGTELGLFKISLPGYHNAKNSLAVIALLLELGVTVNKIQEMLVFFAGTKRRSELLGQMQNGTLVIDDYAHHPLEIKKTLEALKNAYPKSKITCIFQPHTYSRTNALLTDFVSAFSDADTLILLPTFASARDEEEDVDVYNQKLIEEFRKINKNVLMLQSFDNVIEYIIKNTHDLNRVVVTMGAGDVYKIGYSLIEK